MFILKFFKERKKQKTTLLIAVEIIFGILVVSPPSAGLGLTSHSLKLGFTAYPLSMQHNDVMINVV